MEYDAFSSTNTQSLSSCGYCGRNFNPDALSRHEPICAKSANKKRKVYDMSKHRAEGTELQQFKGAGAGRGRGRGRQTQPEPPKPKNNWRAKHEDFINSIRAARGVQKAIDSGAPLPPPPPPTINPDYVQCPHCARRFNETAAARHMNFCKEQHDRLPNKKKPDATAMQRAAARTQYKAPKMKTVTSPPSSGYSGSSGAYSGGYKTPTGRGAGKTATTGGTARYGTAGGGGGGSGSGMARGSTSASHQDNYGPSVSGRALRTGRTAETYSEARQLSAKQRSTMPSKSHRDDDHHEEYPRYGGYGSSTNTGPTYGGQSGGVGMRNGDHGYHSGDSDFSSNKMGRSGSGIARFCHECGTKYPVTEAKFCCECGVRRVNIT